MIGYAYQQLIADMPDGSGQAMLDSRHDLVLTLLGKIDGNKCKSRVNIDNMELDYKPNIYFLFIYLW